MAHGPDVAEDEAGVSHKRVDIAELVGSTKEDQDKLEAASDALTVGALLREMRERAELDPMELKLRLKPFLKLSKEAIVKAEKGIPAYHDRRHLGDNVLSNYVLLATVARVCDFELIVVPKVRRNAPAE
jgi:hypothetical protein